MRLQLRRCVVSPSALSLEPTAKFRTAGEQPWRPRIRVTTS